MLTERQKELYNYLLEQKSFVSQWEIWFYTNIYDDLYDNKHKYNMYLEFHDSPTRHAMTKDIRVINESGEVDKIIISTSQGIKIATEEEFKQYIDAEFAAIFRKLKRTYAKAKKANLDGQYNFKDQVIEVFN